MVMDSNYHHIIKNTEIFFDWVFLHRKEFTTWSWKWSELTKIKYINALLFAIFLATIWNFDNKKIKSSSQYRLHSLFPLTLSWQCVGWFLSTECKNTHFLHRFLGNTTRLRNTLISSVGWKPNLDREHHRWFATLLSLFVNIARVCLFSCRVQQISFLYLFDMLLFFFYL